VPPNSHSCHAGNILLSSIPPEEYGRLEPVLRRAYFQRGQFVLPADNQQAQALFPMSGVYSLMMTMIDGRTVDVAVVGNEGMLGVPAHVGLNVNLAASVCQVEGEACIVPAPALRAGIAPGTALEAAVIRYAQALSSQILQVAACNSLHLVRQRLASRLLAVHDRALSDEFRLSQQFISQMLGVRRATVSALARTLQDIGLIRYRHGVLRIVDRQGLEGLSCECYSIVRHHYDELLPALPWRQPSSRVR
jgi:CRP-like cAMP-binding protein